MRMKDKSPVEKVRDQKKNIYIYLHFTGTIKASLEKEKKKKKVETNRISVLNYKEQAWTAHGSSITDRKDHLRLYCTVFYMHYSAGSINHEEFSLFFKKRSQLNCEGY